MLATIYRQKPASLTYHTQRHHGIVLDEPMEPSEKDGYRPQKDIDGIPEKVGDQLDELGEDHPCCKSIKGGTCVIHRPFFGTADKEQPK